MTVSLTLLQQVTARIPANPSEGNAPANVEEAKAMPIPVPGFSLSQATVELLLICLGCSYISIH